MKVFTAKQIAEIDRCTLSSENITEYTLVKRVAKALSVWFKENISVNKRKIYLFAGSGNNGNDVIAMAANLGSRGFDCYLYVLNRDKSSSLRNELLEELYIYGSVYIKSIKSSLDIPSIEQNSIVIDGIFGTGLNRKVDGIHCDLINTINRSNSFVISIDVPSGLFSDKLNEDGTPVIVNADNTLTLEFPKLCMFYKENYCYIGKWFVVSVGLDLGIISRLSTPYKMIVADTIKPLLRVRDKYSHKGTYGHAFLIAGSFGMAGSAVLAARSALRSGVGLLTVHVPQKLYDVVQISVNEAICTLDASDYIISSCFGSGVYGSKETIGSYCDLDKYSAIAIGPGIGKAPDTVNAFKELLKYYDSPMVIDADAINILSSHKEMLKYVPEYSILTPHPKEFKRMVGDYINTEEAIQKQVDFSKENKVIVVLKGANTSISTPDGMLYFNSTGNPGMATAGSGDVLCGVLLGLLAQGYSPEASAIIGVYLHSLSGDIAADKLGQESLIAGDIIDNLGSAFLSVYKK